MHKLIYIVAVPGTVRSFLAERMHYLSNSYDVAAVCSPGPEHEQFRQEGLNVHAIPITRRISPLKDIVSLVRLYLLLKKERPTIVHTITPKASLLGMIAAWAAGVPIRIAMFNGELNLPSRFKRAIVRVTNALTCLFATHLNADGFGTRQYLLEQRVTRKYIEVFWKGNINGIDFSRFHPNGKRVEIRSSLGIGDSTVVYIYVGRIVHDKGIDELISAFVGLKEKDYDVALILVGAEERHLDPIADKTRHLIENTPNIYAVGWQSNVPDWLEAGDVFVLPSHREGCNCSLLEAGAMSLPSVASDIRGCREIIQEGVNGVFHTAGDTSSLLGAMIRMYSSSTLRQQLGAQGRFHVEVHYNRKDVWRTMQQFYDVLVCSSTCGEGKKTDIL